MDLLDVFILIYLDDVLILSYSTEVHTQHVQEVLRRLHANNLYITLEKCAFTVDTTNFIGFIIGPHGLHMDESKMEVMRD